MTQAATTTQVIAGAPVKTRTCRRCAGKGTIQHFLHNNYGICLACGGNRVTPVYTKAQKAAIENAATDRAAAARIFREAVKGIHHTERHVIEDAELHLREFAPERHDRMVAAILGGRIDAVLAALAAYATETDIYASWAK